MSKPSSTNSPKLLLRLENTKLKNNNIKLSFSITYGYQSEQQDIWIYYGGYSYGDPPLPIPHREVKPVSADGTAIPSGRVGSRHLLEGQIQL